MDDRTRTRVSGDLYRTSSGAFYVVHASRCFAQPPAIREHAWRAHPLEVGQGQHFIWPTYSVQVVKAKRDQRLIDKASKIGRNDERSP
jgi:hypothetical protein